MLYSTLLVAGKLVVHEIVMLLLVGVIVILFNEKMGPIGIKSR